MKNIFAEESSSRVVQYVFKTADSTRLDVGSWSTLINQSETCAKDKYFEILPH